MDKRTDAESGGVEAGGRRSALTAAEWRDERFKSRTPANNSVAEGEAAAGFFRGSAVEARGFFAHDGRHALAALALHGQPFGFSEADMGTLQDALALANRAADWPLADRLVNLFARVGALLPPGSTPTR